MDRQWRIILTWCVGMIIVAAAFIYGIGLAIGRMTLTF
jgi:hypothetical protein